MLQNGGGDLLQRVADEGLAVGEQLVKHDAEREHVGAAVGELAPHLLGRHVVRRAGAGVRVVALLPVRDAGNAEVEHAWLGPADHEDVGRLDVAVDHALGVGEGERVGDATDDERRLRRRRAPAFLAQLAQVAALQEFHRDVGALVADAGIEDGDDVRMAQAAGGARFVQEQRIERFALLVGDLDVERLDRDQARQQRIVGREDGAQAALAELVLERVAADVADRRDGAIGRACDQAAEGDRRRHRNGRRIGIAPQPDAGKGGGGRGLGVGGRHGRRKRTAHCVSLSEPIDGGP